MYEIEVSVKCPVVTSAGPTVQAMRSVRSISLPARGSASRNDRGSVRCAKGVCSAWPSRACVRRTERTVRRQRPRPQLLKVMCLSLA